MGKVHFFACSASDPSKPVEWMFTENETNACRLYGVDNKSPYVTWVLWGLGFACVHPYVTWVLWVLCGWMGGGN